MKPTAEDIQRMFDEFNALIFNSSLKPIPIHMDNTKRTLGSIHFKRSRNFWGRVKFCDFTLHITQYFDLPEREIEDILIHEMIHYHILSKQLHDTSPHGRIFKQMMNDINSNYGRHITISRRASSINTTIKKQIKSHYVCVALLKDGRYGVMVSARTRVFDMWHIIPIIFHVSQATWYISKDPYFNQFPNAIKPRLYVVDKTVIDEHLLSAQELINDGHKIILKKE